MTAKPRVEVALEIRLNQTQTDAESRAAYDAVYGAADLSQQRSFYLWLMDLLALNPSDRYLDVSCGRAELPALAAARSVPAFGLDLAYNAVHHAAKTGVRDLITANSQLLPYADNSFSVISNIGSLEHYVDMPQAVREMARVLRPDGRALILVPNTYSLFNNIWLAWREGHSGVDPYQPIQRYAARQEWQNLLEENGLRVQKTIKYERVRPRNRPDLAAYVRQPKQLLRLLLTPFIPLNLAFCFVYICTKAGTGENVGPN